LNEVAAISDLNDRWGIPGLAVVTVGQGGSPRVAISTPLANGEMYLHGGHVTAWKPKAVGDVLYCSPNTIWKDGKAIRGGVPVCFPWFGDKTDNPAAPAHGFVRTKAWQLQSIEKIGEDIAVSMFSQSSDETRKWWPFDFQVVCRATFGAILKLELVVTNTSVAAFSFEEALHAYFAVGDAASVSVSGLDGTLYVDKVDHFTEKTQYEDIRFSAETDRIYLNTRHDITMSDPVVGRKISIHKENSATTVVWNPWAEKSAGMGDLGAGEWKKFVCVESSNVGTYAVQLSPGESHTMAAIMRCA